MKQVIITISPFGEATVEAKGFSGSSCVSATAPLELVLGGGQPADRKPKPEMYKSDAAGFIPTRNL